MAKFRRRQARRHTLAVAACAELPDDSAGEMPFRLLRHA